MELAELDVSLASDVDAAAASAKAQVVRAREARMNAAEGHDRTARVHEDAAEFEAARGRAGQAAKHLRAAEHARRLAELDRDPVD